MLMLLFTVFITSCNKEQFLYDETGTITDKRDGQTYSTVKIGDQWWMAENLNYETSSGSWCYDNKTLNCDIYGRLYDSPNCTVDLNDIEDKICPPGWSVPGDDEWKTLEQQLGMSSSDSDAVGWRESGNVGIKLKSNNGWIGADIGTNESGFSALPGGFRLGIRDNDFVDLGSLCYFWSSTVPADNYAWSRAIRTDFVGVRRSQGGFNKGKSVRCIKDE